MTTDIPDLQVVLKRLDKLERENRRAKRGGAIVLAAVGALVLMGQAKPRNRIIEADAFILTDPNGKTRADLSILKGEVALSLWDSNEKIRTSLAVGPSGPRLSLVDTNGEIRATLDLSQEGPSLYMRGAGDMGDDLQATSDFVALFKGDKLRASLSVAGEGPRLLVSDSQGFRSILGVAELETPRTGESHKTSAATLSLFDKDGKVLWRTP